MANPVTPDGEDTPQLYFEENQIEELAAIMHAAAGEYVAPNWTLDLIRNVVDENGHIDPEWLRVMARRWCEFEFEPTTFAARIERLADAIEDES